MNEDVRKYIAEFVGTFALVFIGTAVAATQGGSGSAGLIMVSCAFGGTLAVQVLVIGPISGCHLNPAVTIPMVLSGRLKGSLAPGYIIAQFLGGIAASVVLLLLLKGLKGGYDPSVGGGLAANGNPLEMSQLHLFGWEVVLTALFLFTIFSATRPNFTGGFHAIAIGGYLFLAHLVGAQFGDSSLNPARSFGPAIVSGQGTNVLWVFLVAPVVGGILGWLIYKVIYAD